MIKHKHKIEFVNKLMNEINNLTTNQLIYLQENNYILFNETILGNSWMCNTPFLNNIPIKELRKLYKKLKNENTLL